jgi:DNA-binding transcriptional regulator GbsR (MarR family)
MPKVDKVAASPFPASLGELLEQYGWSRLAGRVIGELMLADPPYLSTAELCARIGTSASHLSSAITTLESMRMIDRFGRPGTRQHHYRLREGAFLRPYEAAADSSRALAEAADRALADVPSDSRAAEELTVQRDFFRFLEQRLPELVTEFRSSRT